MFGFPDIDSFRMRQIVTAVSRERAPAVGDLVRRLSELRYYIVAVSIAEHEWVRAAWRDESLGHDAGEFVKRIASGPIANVNWDEMTPIDRTTLTDRWLRTVGCGMAYGPGFARLQRDKVEPLHVAIHDDVLALFDANCEIRHNYDEEVESGHSANAVASGATFETFFVLRDAKMTGVFLFGEED
jgi:hypothetical protein